MVFTYEDIQLNSIFLIVKESNGRLKGQACTLRPIDYELLPDKKIDEVIDILTKKDVDRFLAIKHIDESYRKEVEDYLKDFGEISSTYIFLDTDLRLGGHMAYLKDYLVKIDGVEHILTLRYNVISKDELDLRLFYVSPYRKPFEVMH
jgi:hypothetical protein